MAITTAPAGDPPQPNAAPPPPAIVPAPITTTSPPAAAPVAPPPVVQIEEEDRAAGATSTDQHVAVPHDAFRRIKDSAKDKGRKEHEAALNARAVKLGYPTAEAMFAALENKEITMATTAPPTAPIAAPAAAPAPIAPPPSSPPAAAPAPAPTAPPPAAAAPVVEDPNAPENDRRVPDPVRKKLRAAREEMRTKTAQAEAAATAAQATAQQYQAQIETMRVEQTMREDMIRGGVKDIDYVFFKMKEHLAALTKDTTPEGKEKLKAFDLKMWMEEERKSRPYLFGEQPVPANTGATPAVPPPPNPGAVGAGAGDAQRVDARTLPPDQFQKRMKEMGITTSGSAPVRS